MKDGKVKQVLKSEFKLQLVLKAFIAPNFQSSSQSSPMSIQTPWFIHLYNLSEFKAWIHRTNTL